MLDLGDDLDDASINRIALTTQLAQLLKEHLKTLARTGHLISECGRRHNHIIATTTDKNPPRRTAKGQPDATTANPDP
jgi:hypothetical protein